MSTNASQQKRLLIVDDEQGVIDLIKAMLGASGSGMHTVAVTDGEQALETCRVDPPDVMLLDIRMPGIDGFETCRALKADKRTEGIRIVMLSAFTQRTHIRKSAASGADAFLSKPFTAEQLAEALG